MEYQLKKINIDSDGGKIEFPPLQDRVIEMRGQVIEITLSGLIETQKRREKAIKELKAKIDLEKAKMENIESFHPFVKDMSEQDLHTAWLYRQSQAIVNGAVEEVSKLEGWIDADNKELVEIKNQIPELSDVILEVDKILNKND